ncbi:MULTISPECIES: lysozyme [unclassified Brevundimonas]|uniref:lysozyme n=1 Tax=unclassified Brevundimonas TaxID=2622653 RepID=UPI0025BBB629|nr:MULTISPECIES: lysozyme [unclassified Brevundimonas]
MLLRLAGERARFEMGHSVSAAPSQRLKVSREGLLLIKSFEGFRPRTVRRRDGAPVIGYGHTKSARAGATITEVEAELLLQYDLLPIVDAINSRVSIPLNQHQFDALASFIFSVGVQRFEGSDVLEQLNAGAPARAAEALSGWPDRVQPPVDAPYRRRSAERALFDAAPDRPAPLDLLLTAPVRGPHSGSRADDEAPATVQVLRHERRAAQAPVLNDTGAVIFIGGIGLLAFAAGVAAFRRVLAAQQSSDGTVLIGGALAVIGLIFIGVAGWNLTRKRNNKRVA